MTSKLPLRQCILSLLLVILAICAGMPGHATGQPAIEPTAGVARVALLPDAVFETSGLALVGQRLWTLNDSGDDAVLYGLSADGRRVDRRLFLAGAVNVDWEAMALDRHDLYIVDAGNNLGLRRELSVYRVPLTALDAPDGSQVPWARLTFRYRMATGQRRPDCEAAVVVGNELWLFSKNRRDGHSNLYRLDLSSSDQTVTPVASLPVDGLVTGADYDPQAKRLALLGYSRERMPGYSFLWLVPVEGRAPDWRRARRYRLDTYAQWEAISWDGARRLVLTTERSPLSDTRLAEIRLDSQGVPRPPLPPDSPNAYW